MKQIVSVAAATALLAACGAEPAEETVTAEPMIEEQAVAAPTMESYVGEWNATGPDGSTWVTTNNPDGTFSRVMADGTTNAGSWTFDGTQGCWTTEGGEPVCYTITPEDAAGSLVLTPADGAGAVTATRVTEGAQADAM